MGYTKQRRKPCLHALLVLLAEVRLGAQLWLRPGNTPCGGNSTAFFLDLWENLPRHRVVSPFCLHFMLLIRVGGSCLIFISMHHNMLMKSSLCDSVGHSLVTFPALACFMLTKKAHG